MTDKFDEMFSQQREFMELLKKTRSFPDFPVDITTKDGQQFCKKIAFFAVEELFEALQHLKQKDHRVTDVSSVDREQFLEELSDAFHYMLEICILTGITSEELHSAFIKKGVVNTSRISNGY